MQDFVAESVRFRYTGTRHHCGHDCEHRHTGAVPDFVKTDFALMHATGQLTELPRSFRLT